MQSEIASAILARLNGGDGDEPRGCQIVRAMTAVAVVARHGPASTEVMLLRVCQEALSNVRKHAGAALQPGDDRRDPQRAVPADPAAVVSPADGHVVEIVEEALDSQPGRRISIFLSIWDVHVQRAPVPGRIAAGRME